MPTIKETHDLRLKFHNTAREQFPDVGEPGTVWVLSTVLGWEWDKITTVCIDGFGPDGYKLFILDSDGKRVYASDNGNPPRPSRVTRKWTKAEKSLLKDWWWLLGY